MGGRNDRHKGEKAGWGYRKRAQQAEATTFMPLVEPQNHGSPQQRMCTAQAGNPPLARGESREPASGAVWKFKPQVTTVSAQYPPTGHPCSYWVSGPTT